MNSEKKRRFKMPTSVTIVMIFLVIVTILTWIVPTSVVTETGDGVQQIHYNAAFDGDGNIINNSGTAPKGIWDIIMMAVHGFEAAADIGLTIFISGGTLAVLNYTGALDAGISRMLKKHSGKNLIRLLMLVFGLMGTVYGSWEDLPPYCIVIIPLFVKAGYDVMTGIMVVLIGGIIGNMSSIVNPYSIGAAVGAIGNEDLSLGSGILMRLIMFVTMYLLGSFLVVRYAEKVRKNPEESVVHDIDTNTALIREAGSRPAMPDMTGKRKASLVVFICMVMLTVIGYIPWHALSVGGGKTAYDYVNAFIPAIEDSFLGHLLGMGSFLHFGDWYFDEFTVTWLIGGILIGIINKMPEKTFVKVFSKGAADLINVVFVLGISRGIALTMGTNTEGMSVTFIYWIKTMLDGVPIWAFAIVCVIVYILVGIFLQSTSGVAGITMPIFGAVAMSLFAASKIGGEGGQVVLLSGFTIGINLMCGIYPGAINMGVIEMVNVPYDRYLKLSLYVLLPVTLLGTFIITIAPYLHLI